MNQIKENIGIILAVVFFIAVIAIAIMWEVYQWNMCRDSGLEFWYCVQHTFGVLL